MAKSSIDIEELKQFIAKDESGGDYNIYNFGKSGGGGIRSSTPGSKYYKKDAISLTNKTVRQILTLQRSGDNPLGKGDIFAVGKFQLIPGTLYSVASKLKLLDSLFNETTQEKLGDYLVLEKRSDTGRYIKGLNGGSKQDLEDAVQALGLEFASFPIITRDGQKYGNVDAGTGNKAYYGGSGPNPSNSKYTIKDVVRRLIKARLQFSEKNPSYIPSYCSDIKLAPPPQTKISGKITDEKGQPVAGAVVKVDPPKPVKLSEPILNTTTGKYEVKDENGNIIADSIDKETARKQASTKVNSNAAEITNPPPLPPKAPTYVVYRKKDDGTTAPDGAIITFEESGPQKTAILTPSDSNISNTPIKSTPSFTATFDILANTVLGTYKNLLSSYYGSTVLEPGRVFYQPNTSTATPPSPSTASKTDESPVTVTTDKDGNWEITAPTTFDPKSSTITFSKEGHEIREITNIQQTGGDITGGENKTYDVPRLTMFYTPDITGTATNKLNQEILNEETALIKQQGNSELSAQERLANMANNKKEEFKKTIIPFIIKLLLPFGAVALQAVISKIPLDKIKDQISCPSQAKILELINKRNKLVKQINNAYKTINTLTKTLSITSTAITAIQAGIAVIEVLPYPATGVPPVLPPLTSGIIEVTGSGKDKLKDALKKANVVISIVTLALAAFGAILGIILRLLNNLDALIQQCAQEQEIPFEVINDELNSFVNQSTGVDNSNVIQATQEDDTYKGFTLELKPDATNSSKYPRRFAQALNKIGIPVLKTDSSFASDPQVLLDQLKFIIDSNPQLTAE
jgi:hypothetical protein